MWGWFGVIFFFRKTILSHFTFYAIFNIKKNSFEKCPFTYWLNGRWFLQIVDRDSGNLYIQYNPLFPCSDFGSQTYQMWGWFFFFGGGGNIFLAFMLFPTILEKINSGNKKQNIFLFRKTIVDRDSGNLYPIYIKKQIVVLASEPVGGRSRVTELPCLY